MNEIKVTGNLGKSILQLSAQFSSPSAAIWEYVSNSLEYRSQPDGCRINVVIEKNKITIADNSDGMDSSILHHFFTVSGENQARKGNQSSWLKRGLFGTGKLAAFGIGNNLIVETNKNGLKNSYKLSRKAIEASPEDANSIPLEAIKKDIETNEPDGTMVILESLNVKVNQHEIIRKIEREIASLREYDINIAVNDHLCEFKQLEILSTHKFESSGAIRERYGDFELEINVSRTPLDESERGIKIMNNKSIIGVEDCGISSKEFGNQITGKVDIPQLEEPINNVNSFDQTRSHKLNQNHAGVRELVLFMAPKIEKIRKDLLDEKNKERTSTQSKKLSEITNQLSDKFNKQWNELKRQLNEIRTSSNSRSVSSLFVEPGDDPELNALEAGEDVDASEYNIRTGEQTHENPSNGPSSSEFESGSNNQFNASKTSGSKTKRRRGGFLVDHDKLGEDEHRSIYNKDELKIVINLDHPSVKNCLKSCHDDVENISFKRLIFEIAFREFEHAIAQEMIFDNDMYPPSDLLYEMRSHYDRIARVIGSDLYSY
jgi:hypothetical protein